MIGGNINGIIQTMAVSGKNAIGEAIREWTDAITLNGWLGMQSGERSRNTYNAKIEESTHVFLCDYNAQAYTLANQDVRMIIKGFVYDVTYIDNPDELDQQLEIYLKRVGAWNGESNI